MKAQKYTLLILPTLLVLLQGSKCNVSNELDVDALDVGKYTTNWTQMASVANFRGTWNEQTKTWDALAIEDLAGGSSTQTRLLPAYVPVLAGNCDGVEILKNQIPQTQDEVQSIVDAFKKNEDESGRRNKIVLIGEPGIDVDARVQALAWRIAKGCSGIPESWKMREVISVDLRKLRDDAKAKNLTSAVFVSVLKKILDELGGRAIFYLNGFSELANHPVNVGDVIKLFLDYNASVIFEATPTEFNQYFADRGTAEIVHQQNLMPIPSDVILPAISALAQAESKTENVNVGADVAEDVVRLSRAFLPGKGSLSQAVKVLSRGVQDARSKGLSRSVDRSMVVNAVYLLDAEKLQRKAIETSDALDRGSPLARLDSNIWLLKEYYIDVQKRNLIADAVRRELDPAFDNLQQKVKSVSERVAQAEKNVLDGLVAKTNLLRTRINNVGRKLDASELRVTQQLVQQSALIVEKYEALSTKMDASKAALLNKVVEAQGVIIANVDKRFGELTQKQEDLMNQLSWTHSELANRITAVDTRVQKASAAALDTIAKLELRIGQELEFVSDSIASLLVEVTQANRSLASLGSQVETLSMNEAETFNQLLKTHDVLVKQALPKLTELTDPQVGVIASLQNAVSSLTLSFNKGHDSIVRTLTNVQNEIAYQFTSLGDKLSAQESRVLTELANANAALATQSTKLDMLSSDQQKTYNQLLATHKVLSDDVKKDLAKLTDPQLGVLAALNASTTSLSNAFQKGNDSIVQTLTNVQSEIAAQFASVGDKLSEQEARVLAEIAKANDALATHSTKLDTLSTDQQKAYTKLVATHDLIAEDLTRELQSLTNPQRGVLASLSATTASLSAAFQRGNEAIITKLTEDHNEVAQKLKSLGNKLTDLEANLLIEVSKANEALATQAAKLDTLSSDQQKTFAKLIATHDLISDDLARELQSLTNPQRGVLASLNAATASLATAFKRGNDTIAAKLTTVQEEVAQKFKSLGKQLTDQEAALLIEVSKANDALATQASKLDGLSSEQQKIYTKLVATHDLISEDVTRELQNLTNPQRGVLASLNAATASLATAFQRGNESVVTKLTNIQDEVAQKFNALGQKLTEQESKVLGELANANASLAVQASKLDTLSAEQLKTYNQLLETHRVLSQDVTKELTKLTTAQAQVLEPLNAATTSLSEAIKTGNASIISSLTTVQDTIARQFESLGTKVSDQEAKVLAEVAKANASLATQSTKLNTLSVEQQKSYDQLMETHRVLSDSVAKELVKLTDPQLGVLASVAESTASISKAFKKGNDAIVDKLTSAQSAIIEQFDNLGTKLTEQESKVLGEVAKANASLATQSAKLETLSTAQQNTYLKLLETHRVLSEEVKKDLATLTDPQLGVLASLNASTTSISNAIKKGGDDIVAKLTDVQNAIAQQFMGLGTKLTEQESKVLDGFAKANQGFADALNLALTDKNAPIQSNLVRSIASSLREFETTVKESFQEKLDEVQPTLVADIKNAVEALVQTLRSQVPKMGEIDAMTQNLNQLVAVLKKNLFQIEGVVFDGDKVLAQIMKGSTALGKCLSDEERKNLLATKIATGRYLLVCGQWCLSVSNPITYASGNPQELFTDSKPNSFIQKLNYQGKEVTFECAPYVEKK